ncbi:MAG: hypothetical protein SFV24_05995 [Gemmatimonadales bacterium]|nr:hypothetical protein [Gemmatimonadales bacterium]
MHRAISWGAALVVVVGCSGVTEGNPPPPPPPNPLAPTAAFASAGDGQWAIAGLPTPDPLQVTVVSATGVGVKDVDVSWVVMPGGGSVVPLAGGKTDANGRASATWTMGPVPGVQRIEARVGRLPTVSFGATAIEPPPGQIAFLTDERDLAVARGDGQDAKVVLAGPNLVTQALSPDGTRIAFARGGSRRAVEIYVVNVDGRGVVRLTTNDVYDGDPAWSPDGQRLVFARATGPRDNDRTALWIMDADGGSPRQLTAPDSLTFDSRPDWSPDGAWIGYQSSGVTEATALWQIRPDGTDRRAVPGLGGGDGHHELLRWSPDGTRLAFRTTRWQADPFEGPADLAVMRPGGTELQRLTMDAAVGDFAWSPDGTQLVFQCGDGGTFPIGDLCLISRDGTRRLRLARGVGGYGPSWSVELPLFPDRGRP